MNARHLRHKDDKLSPYTLAAFTHGDRVEIWVQQAGEGGRSIGEWDPEAFRRRESVAAGEGMSQVHWVYSAERDEYLIELGPESRATTFIIGAAELQSLVDGQG